MQWPQKGSVRAAAWFVASLCGMTLVLSLIPFTEEIPAIPFFAFLPVVFFMIADQHERSEETIRELEERIKVLEANAHKTPR